MPIPLRSSRDQANAAHPRQPDRDLEASKARALVNLVTRQARPALDDAEDAGNAIGERADAETRERQGGGGHGSTRANSMTHTHGFASQP